MSVSADTVTAHEQRSARGLNRRNKFREVARSTDNPTTKLLADGLTALTEALRELDSKLETLEHGMTRPG